MCVHACVCMRVCVCACVCGRAMEGTRAGGSVQFTVRTVCVLCVFEHQVKEMSKCARDVEEIGKSLLLHTQTLPFDHLYYDVICVVCA